MPWINVLDDILRVKLHLLLMNNLLFTSKQRSDRDFILNKLYLFNAWRKLWGSFQAFLMYVSQHISIPTPSRSMALDDREVLIHIVLWNVRLSSLVGLLTFWKNVLHPSSGYKYQNRNIYFNTAIRMSRKYVVYFLLYTFWNIIPCDKYLVRYNLIFLCKVVVLEHLISWKPIQLYWSCCMWADWANLVGGIPWCVNTSK